MAHDRKRHIAVIFQKLLGFKPITGLFGHRQVGKSTFIASVVKEYRTLDDVSELESANLDPKRYISAPHGTPLAIDECQMEPKLFPTLKEWVRTHPRPGQFVVSGSVRFTSRKSIRESLAGRMSVLEMFPFSTAEIAGEPLPEVVRKLLDHHSFTVDALRILAPSNQTKKNISIFIWKTVDCRGFVLSEVRN
jgi:predicted AAA+ superfamily ATPase